MYFKEEQREFVENSIIEAGNIMIRKAHEITKDFSDERVTSIWLSINITPDSIPEINIEKTYAAVATE